MITKEERAKRGGNFICDHCGKVFYRNRDMERHQKMRNELLQCRTADELMGIGFVWRKIAGVNVWEQKRNSPSYAP